MPLPEKLEHAFDSATRSAKELIDALWDSRKSMPGREVPIDHFTAIMELVDVATGKLDAASKLAEIYLDPPTETEPKDRPRRSKHSEVHSFIFPKQEWTPVTARAWLRDHKKLFGKMDVVGSSFHFKQTDTTDPEILGTIVVQQSPRIMATLEPRTP